jgi:hypothetical protein
MARHFIFVRGEKTKNQRPFKKKEMEVQHFHFISIVSCESIMPIGHVISQKMAIETTIRVRYKKFLPAASILMNVAWC